MSSDAAEVEAGPCPNQQWCHGNISANCTSSPKLCGKCCSCPHHARRRRRGGKTKGRASKAARQTSIVGLRVSLLETLLDHIIGTDAQELQSHGIKSRRMLRRSLIELFVQEADVHDVVLYDRWDIAWFLRFAPRGLIENVQLHVVAVAAKLKYEPTSSAASSSSTLRAARSDIPPPPGLPTLYEVASSMDVDSDADDDVFAGASAADDSAPAVPATAAAPSPSSWWLEAVAGSQAPRYDLPAHLIFRPQGRFPWNEHTNAIEAHIYRQCGEQVPRWLGGQNSIAMKQHIDAGSPHVEVMAAGSLARAVGMLRSWILNRPGIAQSLRGPLRLVDATIAEKFAPTGLMFGWGLEGASNIPETFNQRGFHATSLYTLQSCIRNGLATGWSTIKVSSVVKKGIYNHIPERVHLCNNYMLHSAVDNSGWFFGPIIEIRYPIPDPQGRATTVRRKKQTATQNLAHPDAHVVVGLYFHAVHWAHFLVMDKAHGHYVEGLFQRGWEIDPAASFEESCARSRPSA